MYINILTTLSKNIRLFIFTNVWSLYFRSFINFFIRIVPYPQLRLKTIICNLFLMTEKLYIDTQLQDKTRFTANKCMPYVMSLTRYWGILCIFMYHVMQNYIELMDFVYFKLRLLCVIQKCFFDVPSLLITFPPWVNKHIGS
jgi:hypothetical protein